MGSLVAWRLDQLGYNITWEDNRSEQVAWKVSTGAIPVMGDELSRKNLLAWHIWLKKKSFINKFVEPAIWTYCSVNPPHQAKLHTMQTVGPLKLTSAHSYHLNAQQFVLKTRKKFESVARDCGFGAGAKTLVIITHGFGDNIWKWSWGWSATVEVEFSPELNRAIERVDPGLRACFYLRRKFELPYLYPIPKTNLYYAGTTLITQQHPTSLDLTLKYENWRKKVQEFSGGHVRRIITETPPREGWRPMANPEAPLIEVIKPNTLRIRPQYGNGIRFFPTTFTALRQAIDERS